MSRVNEIKPEVGQKFAKYITEYMTIKEWKDELNKFFLMAVMDKLYRETTKDATGISSEEYDAVYNIAYLIRGFDYFSSLIDSDEE